jgi:hypothetical protein
MDLRYGILSEGDSDLTALQIVIERITSELGHTLRLDSSASIPVSGPITPAGVKLRTDLFNSKGLDIGVYFADKDKETTGSKRTMIRDAIKASSEEWLERSAIGIPDPHMEAWMIADEDTLKNYLGIDGPESLPFGHLDAKERVTNFASNYGPIDLTQMVLIRYMAENMDLRVVKNRSQSFQDFCSSLQGALAYLQRVQA